MMGAVSTESQDLQNTRVVIVGGGPGGYEAALVAKRFGAEVTLVERQGLGGSAVLTDVVPSKTLIATADWMARMDSASELGIRATGQEVRAPDDVASAYYVDLEAVNTRVRALARRAVRRHPGPPGARGRPDPHRHAAGSTARSASLVRPAGTGDAADDAAEEALDADVVLIATGATPRELPDGAPDGERILTWTQLYGLKAMPEKLIVVGSGVTGAEFAGAYNALGGEVVLVSSRDRVLPGEDPDAAEVIEEVFKGRGMTVMSRSRAQSAVRTENGVLVTLSDGREVEGSHVLLAVGSIPSTAGLGLEEAGVRLRHERPRRRRPGVAHLGPRRLRGRRLHRRHAARLRRRDPGPHRDGARARRRRRAARPQARLGEHLHRAGDRHRRLHRGRAQGHRHRVRRSARCRSPQPAGQDDRRARTGFIKLYAHSVTGIVLGGVVVAARASELIFPITLAISQPAHGRPDGRDVHRLPVACPARWPRSRGCCTSTAADPAGRAPRTRRRSARADLELHVARRDRVDLQDAVDQRHAGEHQAARPLVQHPLDVDDEPGLAGRPALDVEQPGRQPAGPQRGVRDAR